MAIGPEQSRLASSVLAVISVPTSTMSTSIQTTSEIPQQDDDDDDWEEDDDSLESDDDGEPKRGESSWRGCISFLCLEVTSLEAPKLLNKLPRNWHKAEELYKYFHLKCYKAQADSAKEEKSKRKTLQGTKSQ